jgi:TolB-like protein
VLYELLVGQGRLLRSVPSQSWRPSALVAEVNPQLEEAILLALSSDPADRPASATAMAARLPGRAAESPPDPLAAAYENSIAVLPFADMSPGRDQDFFCEGMSEEIINALGGVAEVRVASYTSSFRFKSKETETRTIGRELAVSWLLGGQRPKVRRLGQDLRPVRTGQRRIYCMERTLRSIARQHLRRAG